MRYLIAGLGWLLIAAQLIWAAVSHPPLVPEGQTIENLESVLSAISRSNAIYAVAFSPDGNTLASGSLDNTIRLWDLQSGNQRQVLQGHSDSVWSIAFSPDGNTLASGSLDNTIRLWDVQSGNQRQVLQGHSDRVMSVAFSPDGNTLASGSLDNTIRLWDVQSGNQRQVLQGHSNSVMSVAFSPDGNTLASGSWDNSIRLWDLQSGNQRQVLQGHSATIWSVTFSPDGNTLASGSWDNSIRLWDLQSGNQRQVLQGHSDRVWSVAFSPDGNTLASGALDNSIRLWDVQSGNQWQVLQGHSDSVWSVAFSPDGNTLASGALDSSIRLWDVQSGNEQQVLQGHSDRVWSVAFSPDGNILASGSDDNSIRLWDVQSGNQRQILQGHSDRVWSVTFSPDGNNTLASSSDDNSIRLWDVQNGNQRQVLQGHSDRVRSVAFSPDGSTLASSSDDNSIRLWDVQSGNQRQVLQGHSDRLFWSVTFSPDGNTLASSSNDNSIRLWDVQSGNQRQVLQGHSDRVWSVAFSPDGNTLASGSDDNSIRLWDVQSGNEWQVLKGHSDSVWSVAFSPDGNTLASGSDDNSIRLWDVQSGNQRQVLQGHSDSIWSVTFNPDGDSIATSSLDGTIRLWVRQDHLRQNYQFKLALIGGRRGAWVSCRSNGKCLRYDNGALLWRRDEDGYLHPIPLPRPKHPAQLEVQASPVMLTTNSGQATPFTLHIANRGKGPAYWINAVHSVLGNEAPRLFFYPPLTHVVLQPGETAELPCFVSAPADYDHPRGGKTVLHLKITSAHGEPLDIEIPVTMHTPSLAWEEARWFKEDDRYTLSISLTNRGEQALSESEFRTQIPDLFQTLDRITREASIRPGETVNLSFALPASLEPAEHPKVSLLVRKINPPMFRWSFTDKPVTMPTPPWTMYTALSILLVGSGAGVYYLRLYRHPLVTQVSTRPEALLRLIPEELPKAQQLLTRTRRLPSILSRLGVQPQWLEGAMTFRYNDTETRAKALARRLGVECQGPADGDPYLWILPLGADFPLNLEQCLLYLVPGELAPADIVIRLRNRPETLDQITMILSPNSGHQTELHQQVSNTANLWVAPLPDELTHLLLSTDPIQELARLISSQVEVTRVSPYQTGGGTNKASVFFGRRQLLSHIINREPANYLVAGGRQLGKSSLLKAIERLYQGYPQVHCYYLVLSNRSLINRLSRALSLPTETSLDGVLDYLSAQHQGRYLFLIDEADSFIRAERERDYVTLQQLRSLSEEGRCHFILAGFWELYESAVLDYQSPLKNFGETLTIGALEAEACWELMTQPMATMNIRYASADSIDHLIETTGQRANLISIACNEILKNLNPEDRVISADDVQLALSSDAVRRALSGWETLAADDTEGNRLDRIIVYATIEQPTFTLGELLTTLDRENYQVAPERVMRSLERLELAYVIGQENGHYVYRVPLFREMILAREPRSLLQRELAYDA